jgi:hypothetical protein
MPRVIVSGEKLIHLTTQSDSGYIRSELKTKVLQWLHTNATGWWYPDTTILSDAIVVDFDLEEDIMSFKLVWT